jgi:tripartite-type tricarboxylate transporter receptor subunit TctC
MFSMSTSITSLCCTGSSGSRFATGRHQRSSAFALLITICAALVAPIAAAEYPDRLIRIVVAFPPGGSNDIAARVIAPPLATALGQHVIVENRPGGNTIIGTEVVARAPADGYTIGVVGFTFLANAALNSKLPFDTLRDLRGVAQISVDPYLVSAHPSLPVKSIKELVDLARRQPGKLLYATNGYGTGQHLTGEMLKLAAGIDILHVPYQGGAPAAIAVIGGHAELLISTISAVSNYLASGRLRALAVTSHDRFIHLKDVPTLSESGYPGIELNNYLGAIAPAATPKPVINRLSAEIVRALKRPEVQDALKRQMAQAAPLGADEFDAVIGREVRKIQKIVKDAKLKIE